MNTFHYDRATGKYLGSSPADPDPMQPGEFLIPAFAVAIAPPDIPEGHDAYWLGDDWELRPLPEPEPEPEPEPIDPPDWTGFRRALQFAPEFVRIAEHPGNGFLATLIINHLAQLPTSPEYGEDLALTWHRMIENCPPTDDEIFAIAAALESSRIPIELDFATGRIVSGDSL